tara:strand:- start:93 stop:491 length:399 start_codon:yes stop_codon:yes gene_type:complete
MTKEERKRFDAKIKSKNTAKDRAKARKKYLASQKQIKIRKQEKEGSAYGRSQIAIQRRIRKEQRKGLSYKERKELREKLAKRESYGVAESGTYRSLGDVLRGQGAEPPMTYSKGDKPVKKFKKLVIRKKAKT